MVAGGFCIRLLAQEQVEEHCALYRKTKRHPKVPFISSVEPNRDYFAVFRACLRGAFFAAVFFVAAAT
ncbi:MAG: hypothetical protein ABI858_01285, partial [Pseudoxanthomonas sp.]